MKVLIVRALVRTAISLAAWRLTTNQRRTLGDYLRSVAGEVEPD